MTIDGSGFYGPDGMSNVTGVSFGGAASDMYYVMGDGVIDAYAPAHAAGTVDVTVTTAAGTSSTSSADQYTYDAPPPASTTTYLYSSADPSTVGEAVTLYAQVYNGGQGTATGTVTFTDGSDSLATVALSDGEATFTTTSLALGSHPITAAYSGDASDAASTSEPLNQVVQQLSTTTYLYPSSYTPTYGQSVTLTASVYNGGQGTPTGQVEFLDGGNDIGSGTLSGGQAVLTISSLTVGDHTLTAAYLGDSADAGSTSYTANVTVQQASTTTTLTSSANPSDVGQAVTFTAEVDGVSGGAPTGTITFMSGTTTLGTGTLSPGGNGSQATLTLSTLPTGTDPVTAVYGGDANYGGSSSPMLNQVVENNGAFVWTGDVSEDWDVAGNWTVNGQTATTDPGDNADVIFSGVGETDPNCYTDGAVTVNSLTLDAPYTGTLTLPGSLTVTGGFDMEGGSINQPGGVGVSDINLMGGNFNWSAGVLNAGPTPGMVNTSDVKIEITGANNLTMGDTLSVSNTSVLLNTTGILTFKYNTGISIGNSTTFTWQSGNIVTAGTGISPTGRPSSQDGHRQDHLRLALCQQRNKLSPEHPERHPGVRQSRRGKRFRYSNSMGPSRSAQTS